MTQIEQIKSEIERRIDELDEAPYYGYTFARDECIKMLRFIESLEKEPAVAINTWQDLQSVYVVTKRHLLDYDNGPIEQFPSSTEELFTEILNAIKGGERYE